MCTASAWRQAKCQKVQFRGKCNTQSVVSVGNEKGPRMSVSKHDISKNSSPCLRPFTALKSISPAKRKALQSSVPILGETLCIQYLAGTAEKSQSEDLSQVPHQLSTLHLREAMRATWRILEVDRGAEGAAAFSSVRVLWPTFPPLPPPTNSPLPSLLSLLAQD